MSSEHINLPWYAWVLIFTLLFTQAVMIYLDAQRRGHNKWLWGFWGLLNFPSNGIVYWFVTRKIFKQK